MIASPRKGPMAVEHRGLAAIATVLRARCDPRWRYTNLAHSMLRGQVWQSRLDMIGLTWGWPDFMLVGPGKVCFLKLKPPRRTKVEHSNIAMHLMQCGCGYGFATTVDDAIDMLTDWGVLLPDEAPP